MCCREWGHVIMALRWPLWLFTMHTPFLPAYELGFVSSVPTAPTEKCVWKSRACMHVRFPDSILTFKLWPVRVFRKVVKNLKEQITSRPNQEKEEKNMLQVSSGPSDIFQEVTLTVYQQLWSRVTNSRDYPHNYELCVSHLVRVPTSHIPHCVGTGFTISLSSPTHHYWLGRK